MNLNDDDNDEESGDGRGEEFGIPNPENINIGDFLLIKFEKKNSSVHYVAKVFSKYSLTEYQVLHLRKNLRSYIFVFPDRISRKC